MGSEQWMCTWGVFRGGRRRWVSIGSGEWKCQGLSGRTAVASKGAEFNFFHV